MSCALTHPPHKRSIGSFVDTIPSWPCSGYADEDARLLTPHSEHLRTPGLVGKKSKLMSGD